jgi:drug/metabolite transporter (DMT)-like permease
VGLPLAGALLAAVITGFATVLQAIAVRRVPVAQGVRSDGTAALLRSPVYLGALLLVAAGFAITAAALQSLPVFIVQTIRASSLAVTAGLSVRLLQHRLFRSEIAALGGVFGGLVLLALCAPHSRSVDASLPVRIGLLCAVLFLAVACAAAVRTPIGRAGGVALAVAGGLSFALPPVAARGIDEWGLLALIADPAAWALGFSALMGLGASALALQRTGIVLVTCIMVSIETVLSAVLGVVLYGDRPASGRWVLAVAGVLVTLGSSMALARFGAPQEQELATRAGTVRPMQHHCTRTATGDQPQS